MQIAEKYRKELRDLNEGAGHLPAHAQRESKREVEGHAPEPETLHLKNIIKDEVDLMRETNDTDELETGVERSQIITEITAGNFLNFYKESSCVGLATRWYCWVVFHVTYIRACFSLFCQKNEQVLVF